MSSTIAPPPVTPSGGAGHCPDALSPWVVLIVCLFHSLQLDRPLLRQSPSVFAVLSGSHLGQTPPHAGSRHRVASAPLSARRCSLRRDTRVRKHTARPAYWPAPQMYGSSAPNTRSAPPPARAGDAAGRRRRGSALSLGDGAAARSPAAAPSQRTRTPSVGRICGGRAETEIPLGLAVQR